MRACFVLMVLGACRAPPPAQVDPEWTPFTAGSISEVTTRFLDQTPYVPTAQEQADIEARCPRLARARVAKETDTFHLLTVEGEQLDNVYLVNAWLPDDKLAVAQHKLQDGALLAPVGCERCTLIFGIPVDGGRAAACMGAGYSLTFDHGLLTSP